MRTLKVLIAASVCLTFCFPVSELYGQRVKSTDDGNGWVVNGTGGCALKDQIEVEKARVFDINPARRKKAIQALAKESVVLLSSKDFRELVYEGPPDESLPPDSLRATTDLSGLKPYLLRAVSANTSNRSISVHRCHQDLLIFRGSLGRGKPQKDPVVVFLKSKPKRVFVSYANAE